MPSSVHYVLVASYGTGFDADLARATLESAGIPVLLKGNTAGMVGGAFQGIVPGGVEIHVPSPELERARTLLQP